MKSNRFISKVNKKVHIYHYWQDAGSKDLFEAICNPGLTRTTKELCMNIKESDVLCKVCKIHL